MSKLRKSQLSPNLGIVLDSKENMQKAADVAMAAGAVKIDVFHDDWCTAVSRDDERLCNCKPTVVARSLRPDEMMRLPLGSLEWAG